MWLVLDSPYLCYRAFFSTGFLSFDGDATGVLFGFLRDIRNLLEQFDTDKIAFCFDKGTPLRQNIYPKYKQSRREKRKQMSEVEKLTHQDLRKQIKRLRTEILPALGFRNIFAEEGYEADDLIAAFCEQVDEEVVIIGSDKDLLQLISPRVKFHIVGMQGRPSRTITYDSFREQYGLEPSQWADVKAIAGCSTDDVQGVKGVGEKTAAKFLGGKLKANSAAYKKIVEGNRIWVRNKKLVTLPFPGLSPLRIRSRESVTRNKWREVLLSLGIESMRI